MGILTLTWLIGFVAIIAADLYERRWGPRTAWHDAGYALGAVVWPVLGLWALAREITNATPRGD